MELFIINRYTDEEKKNGVSDESELKKILLKKIKKRKSQILVHQEQNADDNKKRKLEDLDDNQQREFNENETNLPCEIIGKLKKEKKSSGIDRNNKINEENIEFQESLIEADNKVIKIKKSKKVKKQKNKTANAVERSKGSQNGGNEINEENNLEANLKSQADFTILGDVHISKKSKVKRKLPDWLANPSVVSVDLKNLSCPIDSIPELDKIFVDKLKENNITHFFPVQSQIIPWLIQNASRSQMYWPNDICVSAPTGSGKTLAFVLPILQVLHKRIIPKIRALVVLPVQELANQVFKVFETYSKSTNLKILLLSKKRPFEEEQCLICKNDGLGNVKTLVDIIVTTPGRLVDHLTKTKGLNLSDLNYLVIDEADRVMENLQNDWLYHLNKYINAECSRSYQIPVITYNNLLNRKKPPNKLLFSATLSQDPEKLQQLGLFQPKLFTSVVKVEIEKEDFKDETKFIGKFTTPAELTEHYITCTKANKPLIIHHLMETKSWKNILCFVNSSEATYRLAFILKALSKKTLRVNKLSSNLSIAKRDSVIKKFSDGKIDILVSSDALARGIDISHVQYVISYDAPKYVKTYVHRIGRTGRAGKEGTSLVLLTSKEVNAFQKMIERAGKSSVQELNIEDIKLNQYENSYQKALSSLKNSLENKKHKLLLKHSTKKKLQMEAEKGKLLKSRKNIKRKKKSSK